MRHVLAFQLGEEFLTHKVEALAEALLYIEHRGVALAVAKIRREVAPFNFDALVSMRSTITRVSRHGSLLLLQVPVNLRLEHSLYRSFRPGDVLIVHQLGCIAILMEPSVPEGIEIFKAGEVIEGFEALPKLQPGVTVTLRVVVPEQAE